MTVTAVYPGSFDPLTNGHINIIRRGRRIFDRVVVAIARNSSKTPTFTVDERIDTIEKVFAGDPNVEVDFFEGLLFKYAISRNAKVILRGLRAVSDFEYELMMATMNRQLESGIETLFMMTEDKYFYVSSRLVKEVVGLGGSVHGLVPEIVEKMLDERVAPQDPERNT